MELKQSRQYYLDNAKFALYRVAELEKADLQDICASIKSYYI